MKNFSQMSATEIIAFLSNFITVAGTAGNEELLGYTAADITGLTNEKTALQTALNDQKNKQEAAKAATTTLNTALKAARADMSTRNRNIQGNARVTNALKTALGLNVKAPKPVQRDPVPPEKIDRDGAGVRRECSAMERGRQRHGRSVRHRIHDENDRVDAH